MEEYNLVIFNKLEIPKSISTLHTNGPGRVPRAETEKMAVSWARGPESQFRGDFFHVKPPTLGGFHPSE